MTRAGLKQIISHEPDLEVSGEACDANSALREISEGKPDLVLADLSIPGGSGLEFIEDALVLHPDLPILVVSMHDEMIYAERVLRAGARGYIMKEASAEELLGAIRRVLSGEIYLSERMSAIVIGSLSARRPRGSKSPIGKLSDREFEVFQLMGRGKSTREIAKQLNLSTKTVDVHRGNIKEKLELANATSLIHYATRWVETQAPTPGN